MAEAPVLGASVACDTYKDYLVLGRTGMGKSTTADRLLVVDSVAGADDVTPVEKEGGNTQLDDILIWTLGGRSVEDVEKRVKFFLGNRAVGLTMVDPENTSLDSAAKDCVLLSNENTRIRVLDVPGFHSSLSSSQQVAALDLQVANQSNLGIMRQILRIQAIKKLRFHRIIYFLPYRGVCERADKSFQEEIEVMYHYFGRLIFDSMIVIATERRQKSTLNAINQEEIEEIRVTLNRIFQLALAKPDQNPDEVQDIPEPPIIYLSLEESNSDVLKRLQKTEVANMDGLQLHLHENTCACCSLKLGVYKTPTGFEPVSIQESDGSLSPYDQSQCHPLIIPKYSKVEKFFGGVAYIVLLGIPLLAGNPWPGFFNHDEECAKCKKPPGSPGCTLIDEEWVTAGNRIKVDHKCEVEVQS
ncbi:uncharacterized protein LOC135338205 [Halichondria panicea]|uniref:uncharacterized protein LOC135338205 n=1 Tax=Halichondria panicea TaxID=6063 RepID=UPI00312B56D8